MIGRYSRVFEVRSRSNLTGDSVWDVKLECGVALTRVKRKRGSRVERPAPIRVLCKCRKCLAPKPS